MKIRLDRNYSLATRLAVLYACSAALLLTLLAWGTYWALNREFRRDENRSLNDTVALLQTILDEDDSLVATLHKSLPHDLEAFHFNRYQLRIIGADGQTLYESRSFPNLSREFTERLPCFRSGQTGAGQSVQSGNTSYRVMQSLAYHRQAGKQLRLLIALDTSQKTRTLSTYLRLLFFMVVVGVALAALMARWLARRGLQPLASMTRLVSRLKVNQLSQRFCRRPWPVELRPLALEFDRLLDEVEGGIQRISGFCLDLAHELRTPLTSLRLEAEIALGHPRTAEDYRTVVISSMEELERLSNLVERLLLLARTDASRRSLHVQSIPLRETVLQLVEFHFAQDSQVSDGVRVDISEDARLLADPPLVELALSNLFSNALKYGQPPYTISWNETSGRGILSVCNHGPAIEPQHQPLIFERLYRVDRSRSEDTPSHGLGLALVRSAMLAHGGEVELQSTEEQTCFRLIFPSEHALQDCYPE